MTKNRDLGACVVDGGVRFRVWAPNAQSLAVKLGERTLALARLADDVFELTVPGAIAGTDYAFVIDGDRVRPDPMSRWQPVGVHGPSRVVDPAAHAWQDSAWRGVPLADYVIYELHVGTFTPEGTFAAVIPRLRHLASLGITAIELMPIAEFPGGRNWGYDGVDLFAPQSTYGGPSGLRALVDACHAAGLAVILDVVYNHLGPEGNYLGDFGPYFTSRHITPWGPAINVDGAHSDGVRDYLITNAVRWFTEYHIDALRLDAIHGIFDQSPTHVLEELQTAVIAATSDRLRYVIAESDLNDVRVIQPKRLGGYGLDAQWSDDFHHALRTVLAEQRSGYFADFGEVGQLAKAITDSFVYDGQHSAHRRRRHGTAAAHLPGQQFVIYLQNHDQIANGSQGKRLATLVGPPVQALATVLLFTAPNLPMLFMGEEYGERAPFLYFVSHSDPDLVTAVREGRRIELGELSELGDLIDPQSEATFAACKLDWSLLELPGHTEVLALHRDLIALRRRESCLHNGRKDLTRVWFSDRDRWIVIERADPSGQRGVVVANLRDRESRIPWAATRGAHRLALATDALRYGGTTAGDDLVVQPAQESLLLPAHAARIYLGAAS